MSDAHTKTKPSSRLRKSKSTSQTEGWSLRCVCGSDLAGLREDESQKIACSNCERLHFILPVNPYPEPKRVKKKRKRKRREGESFPKIALRKTRDAWRLTRKGIYRLITGTIRRLVAVCVSAITGIRNWFTPLRIAITLLILILGFGGLFGYRQQMRTKALQTLRESIALGDQAIQEENWGEATEQFQRAAIAVGQLGRNDQLASKVIQKNRELQAIDGLCTLPLDEIIQSAAGKGKTTLNWQTEFKTMIHNRWLVMESWIVLDASEDKSAAILAFPLPIDGEKINIIWPAGLFRPIKSQGELHVLSAGQIESIERAKDPRFDWEVKIRSESAFLWCFEETLAPLGFELDSPWLPQDSLRILLKQQRKLLNHDKGENE